MKISFGDRSGIDVEYIKSRRHIYLGGWYDSFVGICPEDANMSLGIFLKKLGITLKDCEKSLNELKESK